jgi:hypothetical protein
LQKARADYLMQNFHESDASLDPQVKAALVKALMADLRTVETEPLPNALVRLLEQLEAVEQSHK